MYTWWQYVATCIVFNYKNSSMKPSCFLVYCENCVILAIVIKVFNFDQKFCKSISICLMSLLQGESNKISKMQIEKRRDYILLKKKIKPKKPEIHGRRNWFEITGRFFINHVSRDDLKIKGRKKIYRLRK